MRRTALALVAVIALGILLFAGSSAYYGGVNGGGCVRCHEIRPALDSWGDSTHRGISCRECHGNSFSTDLRMHVRSASRVWQHLRGEVPEQIRLGGTEASRLVAGCASCHAEEFTDWRSGPHGVTYAELFLDPEHNRNRLLVDDCLRCHGMHFEGGIEKVVAPIDRQGPWGLVNEDLASSWAIPCLTCHAIHQSGAPLPPRPERRGTAGPDQQVATPSLSLFDRRSLEHVRLDRLVLPAMMEGDRPVASSPDRRQALCYQCHAPLASRQVFTGDDRTPTGVHEGLSCMACHAKHGQQTRASCAACHPQLSNCGLDVETMDTTFRSRDSPHDVHRVACLDCHPGGIPHGDA